MSDDLRDDDEPGDAVAAEPVDPDADEASVEDAEDDGAPDDEAGAPVAHPLKDLVRASAEALGEQLRQKGLDKARTRQARQLLQRAFVFEQAVEVPIDEGIALVQAFEEVLGQGLSTDARVRFTWRHFHRLMRRWPIKVKCLLRLPIGRAALIAQDMADSRYDRLEAIFELLKVDSGFIKHEVKQRAMNPFDEPERPIVKKQGSS